MKRSMRLVLVFVLLGLLVANSAGATSPVPAVQAQAKDPEAVIRAIFTALNAGDVKTATANIAEDAVLVLLPPEIAAPDPNVIQGKEAITDWWTFLVEDEAGFDLSSFQVKGDRVTWEADMTGAFFTDLGLAPLESEGMGIVKDGLLRSYVWYVQPAAMARLEAAMALAANKEAVRNWFTALEEGDEEAMGELLADDFANRTPGMPEDKEGFIGVWVANKEIFPGGKYVNSAMVAEGDMVFVFGRFEATHTGIAFEGIEPAGAKIAMDYSVLFHMKDGKIAERWATADDVMGMLVPLGFKLTPPE